MSAPLVSCPTCQRKVEWSAASPFRPFCSDRCRLIDLGAWVSEQHVIPGEDSLTDITDGGDIPSSAGQDPGHGASH